MCQRSGQITVDVTMYLVYSFRDFDKLQKFCRIGRLKFLVREVIRLRLYSVVNS